MDGVGPSPHQLRAAIFLHAACESAADAFYDEDNLDDMPLALQAEALRVLAAEYLARAARPATAQPPRVSA